MGTHLLKRRPRVEESVEEIEESRDLEDVVGDNPVDNANSGPDRESREDYTWSELCDIVKPDVQSVITPSELPLPSTYNSDMSYVEIEAKYKIHKETSVLLKVEVLKSYEYFRCVQTNCEEYRQLKESFVVRVH